MVPARPVGRHGLRQGLPGVPGAQNGRISHPLHPNPGLPASYPQRANLTRPRPRRHNMEPLIEILIPVVFYTAIALFTLSNLIEAR